VDDGEEPLTSKGKSAEAFVPRHGTRLRRASENEFDTHAWSWTPPSRAGRDSGEVPGGTSYILCDATTLGWIVAGEGRRVDRFRKGLGVREPDGFVFPANAAAAAGSLPCCR
jgi:hypothetical protein